jgi:two-component system NtrC family sensor kinase
MLQLGERLVFYRKVQPYQDRANQWLLVVQRDRAEVLAPVMEVSQTIWALLGVAVLLCLLLARWAAVRMARPVQHLAEIITRYADGERVRYRDSRKDEIGQAGRAYNYLIDTLARAEQDRERAEAKMATVGELAAGVAHEINNPLNNMTGLAELMEQTVKEGVDPRVLLEDLEVLRQEQRRCADIVQGLLDFGRPRPPTLTRVELPRLVQESIRLLARRARSAGVLLRFAPPGELPPVEGDPGQLQQVLVNVLLNAIQATPSGGWVEVTLEQVDGQLRCRVEDTGEGVPESLLARIFEPFYSTKQDRQGTGLGLSVSYSIVQRHGGRMSAEPRPGGGLSIWFALPLAQPGSGHERLPEAVNA